MSVGSGLDIDWLENITEEPNCSELLNQQKSTIYHTPTQPGVYVGLAVFHLGLVVFPSLLATIMAGHLVSKMTDSPTKIVQKWICILCVINPATYAIVMDFGLVFDYPMIGQCENKWKEAIYWLVHSLLETTLLWFFAFNAVVFYTSIHQRVLQQGLYKIYAILGGIAIAAFLHSLLWVLLVENFSTMQCRIRGSFCVTFFQAPHPAIIAILQYTRILISTLPVLVLVPVSVFLYWRKVKKIVKFNKSLAHSVANISTALLVGAFLWNIPTLLIHLATYHGAQRTLLNLIITYIFQFNYLLYPLVIISMHKNLRRKPIGKLLQCRREQEQQARTVKLCPILEENPSLLQVEQRVVCSSSLEAYLPPHMRMVQIELHPVPESSPPPPLPLPLPLPGAQAQDHVLCSVSEAVEAHSPPPAAPKGLAQDKFQRQ